MAPGPLARVWLAAALSLALAACACTRPATAPATEPTPAAETAPTLSSETVEPALSELDAWLTEESIADRFSGAVLVARGDQILLRRGYGEANRSFSTPITPTTRFQIASLTKQFTAAAILKLQDEGKLTVRDPVCRWVKPCPKGWEAMTVHHLLTHTSGITDTLNRADYRVVSRMGIKPAEQTAATAALPLLFAPGKGYRYSNGGYALLGWIIEQASGRPYAEHMRTALFEPLGLDATGYEDGRTVIPELAQGYDLEGGKVVRSFWRDPSVIFSAGGLYSNADDLLTWTRALHTGRAISPAAFQQMSGRAGPPESYALRSRESYDLVYAYGLMRAPAGRMVQPSFDDEQVFHTGSWNGFRLYLTHAPAANITVVVLSNRVDQAGVVLLTAQKGMAAALGRPTPLRLAPAEPARPVREE